MSLIALCYMLYGIVKMNVSHPDIEQELDSKFQQLIEKAQAVELENKELRDECQSLGEDIDVSVKQLDTAYQEIHELEQGIADKDKYIDTLEQGTEKIKELRDEVRFRDNCIAVKNARIAELEAKVEKAAEQTEQYDIHIYAVDKGVNQVRIVKALRKALPAMRLRLAVSIVVAVVKWAEKSPYSEPYLSIMPWGLPYATALSLSRDLIDCGMEARIHYIDTL